jgi:hypothetical protein
MLSANARIDVVHHWASRFHQWIINGRGVLYWSKDDVTPVRAPFLWFTFFTPLPASVLLSPLTLCSGHEPHRVLDGESHRAVGGVVGRHRVCIDSSGCACSTRLSRHQLRGRCRASLCHLTLPFPGHVLFRVLLAEPPTGVALCVRLCTVPHAHELLFPCCLQYIAVSRSAFCYHYMPGLFYGEVLLVLVLDAISEVVLKPYRVAVLGGVLLAFTVGLWYWSPWVYALPLTPAGVCLLLCFLRSGVHLSPLLAQNTHQGAGFQRGIELCLLLLHDRP